MEPFSTTSAPTVFTLKEYPTLFAALCGLSGITGGLVLVTLFAFLSPYPERLQPPYPTPREESQKQPQNSGPDNIDVPWTARNNQNAGPGTGNQEHGSNLTNTKSANHWTADPLTVFTAILAIVGVVQVLIYLSQCGLMYFTLAATTTAANAAKGSADAAQATAKQMRLEQRAWVVFSSAELTSEMQYRQPLNTRIRINNTGATPAHIERQVTRVFERPRYKIDLSEEAKTVEDELIRGVIRHEVVLAPGGHEHAFRNVDPEIDLDGYMLERLKTPGPEHTALFLIAVVSYRDVFERLHMSMCCYRYDMAENKFLGHRRHNYLT